MQPLPIRLMPGQDLRRALEAAVAGQAGAAFVLSDIGSLSHAEVRLAGAKVQTSSNEELEILTLSGTIASPGSHLHASFSRTNGDVFGGHVAYGCIVRTTAEVLVMLLPDWEFTREPDAQTGYDELVLRRKRPDGDA